ncbi:hypothetical protein [Streptomyces sp. NPDC007083]
MSQANGKYVAAEIHDADDQYGKLRARADSVGSSDHQALWGTVRLPAG